MAAEAEVAELRSQLASRDEQGGTEMAALRKRLAEPREPPAMHAPMRARPPPPPSPAFLQAALQAAPVAQVAQAAEAAEVAQATQAALHAAEKVSPSNHPPSTTSHQPPLTKSPPNSPHRTRLRLDRMPYDYAHSPCI